MDRKPHKCSCGGGGADRGDLETHILDQTEPGHEPVNEDDRTPLTKAHKENIRRRDDARSKIADAAGITVEDLIAAIR